MNYKEQQNFLGMLYAVRDQEHCAIDLDDVIAALEGWPIV